MSVNAIVDVCCFFFKATCTVIRVYCYLVSTFWQTCQFLAQREGVLVVGCCVFLVAIECGCCPALDGWRGLVATSRVEVVVDDQAADILLGLVCVWVAHIPKFPFAHHYIVIRTDGLVETQADGCNAVFAYIELKFVQVVACIVEGNGGTGAVRNNNSVDGGCVDACWSFIYRWHAAFWEIHQTLFISLGRGFCIESGKVGVNAIVDVCCFFFKAACTVIRVYCHFIFALWQTC